MIKSQDPDIPKPAPIFQTLMAFSSHCLLLVTNTRQHLKSLICPLHRDLQDHI